jgi:hypothetical protein
VTDKAFSFSGGGFELKFDFFGEVPDSPRKETSAHTDADSDADASVHTSPLLQPTASFPPGVDPPRQVNPEECKWAIGGRDVSVVLARKEEGEYWDKLQKGAKIATLKVDWDKWKDEDEVGDDVSPVRRQPSIPGWAARRRS